MMSYIMKKQKAIYYMFSLIFILVGYIITNEIFILSNFDKSLYSLESKVVSPVVKQKCNPWDEELKKDCDLVRVGDSFVTDRARILSYLDDFLESYSKRPEKDNVCGIRINHAFAIYVTIKELQPDTIIESGVNSGISTFIMREASSTARIISIDPESKPICRQPKRWLDKSGLQVDFMGPNFKDFTKINWSQEINGTKINVEKTLVYFDDHLPFFPRISTLLKYGFRHVILEDNYRVGQGATHGDKWASAKQVFRGNKKAGPLDSAWFLDNVISYHEFPPLFHPKIAGPHHKKKEIGAFLAFDEDEKYFEAPLLSLEKNEDSAIFERIAKALELDTTFKVPNDYSWTQVTCYSFICYLQLKPFSPILAGKFS